MTEIFSYPSDKYVLLGKVTSARGLGGDVKIFSFSGQPENFSGYKKVVLVDTAGNLSQPLAVEKFKNPGENCCCPPCLDQQSGACGKN